MTEGRGKLNSFYFHNKTLSHHILYSLHLSGFMHLSGAFVNLCFKSVENEEEEDEVEDVVAHEDATLELRKKKLPT